MKTFNEWLKEHAEDGDPDLKDEMKAYLRSQYKGIENVNSKDFDDDMETAIYWFANHHHSGQSSELYGILSTSPFSPGPIARLENEGEMVKLMYQDLEHRFGQRESVKNEHLRTHRERDPFARQEIVGRPVDAHGHTCDECGSEGRNGKLYQYTVESDGGRSNTVKGLFCCKSCMKAYNGV